jgi:hypothetical protein
MRSGFLAIITLAVVLPIAVFAQSFGNISGDSGASFSVSVDPQYPQPRSFATISLLSSSLDLNNATIDVSAGGKDIYQGSVRPVDVPLGDTGTVTNVLVNVTSAGAKYSQTISIQPQDVAIVAEPISSAPVLYPGKPLVPLEGDTRVVAVANLKDTKGKILDPMTLSYAWTVDDTQIANSSGIGKQAIIVASPLEYRARNVSVIIMSQDGSLVGGASLSLTAQDPSVRMYENDPLLGILFDRALSDNYSITGSEDTLYAAPFSLSTSSGMPLLQWFLNGDVAQTGNSITLRPTGSGQGNASLSIVASAGGSTKATENLSLSFGTSASTGLFGL